MGIIYKATNKINDKVYIGLTTQKLQHRRKRHELDVKYNKYNSYFHSAIRKYGWENFKWEIIDEHEDIEVLKQLERLHISRYESNDPFWGYNLTEGGDGCSGYKHTPEHKKYISELLKGKSKSEEHCKNISKNHADISGENNPMFGRHHTIESKRKISEARKGEKNPMYGKSPSKNTRLKKGKSGLFNFPGTYYKIKNVNPWKKVWLSKIKYKSKQKDLGLFEDPLSASIVYQFVLGEITP